MKHLFATSPTTIPRDPSLSHLLPYLSRLAIMFPSLFARSCFLFFVVFVSVFVVVIGVDVGDGDFTFKPDTVMAAVGDELHFHFYPQNHSVIQGDFMNACHPIA